MFRHSQVHGGGRVLPPSPPPQFTYNSVTEISPERLVTVLSDIRHALHQPTSRSDAPVPDLVPSSSEEEIFAALGTDDEDEEMVEQEPSAGVELAAEGGPRTVRAAMNSAALQRGVSVEGTAPETNEKQRGRVIAVSSLGKLGRFGNQIFQYIFARIVADVNHAELVCPDWVGKVLFGLKESSQGPVLAPSVEADPSLANSTFTEMLELDERKSSHGVSGVTPGHLLSPSDDLGDLWGWFQVHTSVYQGHRDYIQAMFPPTHELSEVIDRCYRSLSLSPDGSLRTVVGVHVRRGDYTMIETSSFGYNVPTETYIKWLDALWPSLHNPVLFLATDDSTGAVLADFQKYRPETSETLGFSLPLSLSLSNASFYGDWKLLSLCEITAISNSTFSFSATMMNSRPDAQFFRPTPERELVRYDPYDAYPILHSK